MKKRLFASLLAVVMLLSLLPTTVFAVSEDGAEDETPAVCAQLEGCTEDTHAEGCPLYVEPSEGEDSDSVYEPEEVTDPVQPSAEEQLAGLIAALPAPADIDPENEAQVEAVYVQISDIYAFAEENGLDVEDNETVNAVIAALYPATTTDTIDYSSEDAVASAKTQYNQTDNETFCYVGSDSSTDAVYAYLDSGALAIVGSGAMKDYASGAAPWYSQKTSITAITIEDGITHIGSYAFRDCTGVTGAVALPNSVKSIGEGAFRFCTMTSIDLGRVEVIGNHAIRQCPNLTAVTIPASVKEIGSGAFYSTGSTSGFDVTVDGCTDTVLVTQSFATAKLTSITFKGCTGIVLENQVFLNCTALASVTYENCAGFTMGSSVFTGCDAYVGTENGGSLEIPACVTTLTGNPLPGGTVTFAEGCTAGFPSGDAVYNADRTTLLLYTGSVESFTVPDTVTEIASGAFQNNTTIKEVVLPNGLTKIGISAFSGCTSLEKINLPDSITSIGSSAFASTALTSVTLPANISKIPASLFSGCTSLASVTFKADIETIGASAFSQCAALKEIELADTLTTIGANAFSRSGLTKVSIPDCYVDKAAFSYCTALKEVEIAAGATCYTASPESGNNPFFNNGNSYAIKKLIYHPDTWESKWFTTMKSVEEVTLTGGVAIPDRAFQNVSSLKSASFEKAVSIGKNAFYGTSLTEVVIPESVTDVGDGAFSHCTLLKSVDIGSHAALSDTTQSDSSPFYASGGSIETAVYRQADVNAKWLNGVTVVSLADNQTSQNSYSIKSVVFTNGTPPANNNFTNWTNLIVAVLDGGELEDYALTAGEAPTPTKENYKFVKWCEYNSNTSDYSTAAAVESLAAGKTYIAVYETCNHTDKSYSMSDNVITEYCTTCTHELGTAAVNAHTELTYDGSAKTATVTYSEGWQGGNLTITYTKDGENVSGFPTDAGTYTASIAKDNVTASAEFTIAKAESTISISADPASPISGGGIVTLTVSGVSTGVTVTCSNTTYNPTPGTDGKYTVSLPNSDATYTFTATYAGGNNHKAASATCTVSVTRTGGSSSGGSSSGSSGSSASGYAVTVDATRNGTVTVSPKNAGKGATVTITVKPKDGYELDGLTVTDKNGKSLKVTEGKNGKYTFTMPASKVNVAAAFTKIEETPERSFIDVPDSYWAADAIVWAAENGYMNGNTASTFNPEGTVTRQQLWMILARLSGAQPADFAEAKRWAVDSQITDGTTPGGAVTRQQLVAILYRYAARMGYEISGTADLTQFPDHASVAVYATDAMRWSVANGIVGGTTQGTLHPNGTATRAQFAVILKRFCENIVK